MLLYDRKHKNIFCPLRSITRSHFIWSDALQRLRYSHMDQVFSVSHVCLDVTRRMLSCLCAALSDKLWHVKKKNVRPFRVHLSELLVIFNWHLHLTFAVLSEQRTACVQLPAVSSHSANHTLRPFAVTRYFISSVYMSLREILKRSASLLSSDLRRHVFN